MEDKEIQRLSALLDQRTMALMERESDLADRIEEGEAQKEELTAAVEELERRNTLLEKALEELRESNQELDQILYRASHDLRSPITSIVGILNLMEYGPLTEIQKECFEHIRNKSTQMDELLKSLSSLSKTLSDDIHFSNTNLDTIIRSCLNELKYLPGFSSLMFRTEVDKLTDVNTDKMLVCIVIKCILANAITFRNRTREGLVSIQAVRTDSGFSIDITDDGIGISDTIKDKVFDMFYRGSELSTGSGLGLYIVKKIVTKLKGSIEFTSSNGLTRFKVIFPNNSDPIIQ